MYDCACRDCAGVGGLQQKVDQAGNGQFDDSASDQQTLADSLFLDLERIVNAGRARTYLFQLNSITLVTGVVESAWSPMAQNYDEFTSLAEVYGTECKNPTHMLIIQMKQF